MIDYDLLYDHDVYCTMHMRTTDVNASRCGHPKAAIAKYASYASSLMSYAALDS